MRVFLKIKMNEENQEYLDRLLGEYLPKFFREGLKYLRDGDDFRGVKC